MDAVIAESARLILEEINRREGEWLKRCVTHAIRLVGLDSVNEECNVELLESLLGKVSFKTCPNSDGFPCKELWMGDAMIGVFGMKFMLTREGETKIIEESNPCPNL